MKSSSTCPRRSGSIRHTALGLAVAAVLAGGCRRAQRYATVQHLSSTPTTRQEYGGDSRPAVEISPGAGASWTIPPGPASRFRTSYLPEEKNGNLAEGQLLADLTRADGATSRWTKRVGWRMGISPGWQAWEFDIPASKRPARVTVSFRPASNPAQARGVFLTPPSLSAPGNGAARIFVLFVIDTLRKDRLSSYGYKLPTSPQIDRFFADGTIWNHCFTESTWTLPSHATIFTSTPPNRHGVGERTGTLPAELPTLAEILSREGYRTLAVTNGGYVDPSFGFGRGFDVYTTGRESTQARVSEALRLLDHYRGEPIFLFLHTYQVHEYSPKSQSAQELFGSVSSLGPSWTRNVADIFNHAASRHTLRGWLNHRYDASIRSVDDGFGDLIGGLRARGLLGSSAILLTSDHGEEIFDRRLESAPLRGFVGHIHPHLYEEYLAVPLMLKCPWLPSGGRRVDRNVSLMDVAPTILSALAIDSPASFDGQSLVAQQDSSSERTIVAKAPRYDALAIRRGMHKLILRPGFPLFSWEDGEPFGELPSKECFDLARDPGERSPGECAEAWVPELELEAERYLAAGFPGCAVLRFPTRPAESPPLDFAVRARARGSVPSIYSFGFLPGAAVQVRGNAIEGHFRAPDTPAWLAIRPARPGEGLEIDLDGKTGFSTGIRRWTEIVWRGTRMLPEAATVFSTPPGPLLTGGGSAPQGCELLQRLRSLGYVAGGTSPENNAPVQGNLAAVPRNEKPFDVPDGSIEVRTRIEVPAWHTALSPRHLLGIAPSTARAGEPFNPQPDGSSALGLTGEGFTREDRVFWNGNPLETAFGSPEFISARVPAELTARPGRVRIQVRSAMTPAPALLEGTLTILPADRHSSAAGRRP